MNLLFRLILLALLVPVCSGCFNAYNTRIPRVFPGRQAMTRGQKIEEKKMMELEDPLPSSALGPGVVRPREFGTQRTESRLAVEQSIRVRPFLKPRPGQTLHPVPKLSGGKSKYPEVIRP
ncbi:MAG: hypothetical protein K0U86_04735 [Planctomycetes bacterium]|nr:hypothetical protein [Planctomycetota bacterium]MCH9724194.1 hypothetical protein [Planctomycetota bacterium]MCH9778905.1 hypothetical protein [Planctomycetota bacterium]MDF1744415.1 hypothetical protein [Gimesia sp.]